MQRFFLIAVFFIFSVSVALAQTTDTETHLVKKGETLYSLSQKYNTTVSRLLDLNPSIVNNNLQAGSSIKVPQLKEDASYKKVKIGPPQYLIPITYTVDKGETLYSIAKKVNNNTETLRMWNDMKTDKIKAGQKLIIGYSDGTLKNNNSKISIDETVKNTSTTNTVPAPVGKENPKKLNENKTVTESKKHNAPVTTDEKKVVSKEPAKTSKPEKIQETTSVTEVKKDTNSITKKYEPTVTAPQTTAPVTTTVKKPVESSVESKLVYLTEKGVATWTKNNNDDGQFYALHPTAVSGTLITVKNMMNSKTIQVKVIGKLPNTADNQNVMIKLSYSAAKELNVLDDKFLATINYMGYKPTDEALK